MQMTFKVGDKAVYPAHGVGEVTAIENREISGQSQTFYILRILDNGMKIMIPTNNVRQVGLREVIGKDKVDKVFRILREKDLSVDTTTWNRRYREYMEKIKTGSVFEVAEVLRDLYLLKTDKDLSFCELKLLDTARGLLAALCSSLPDGDVVNVGSNVTYSVRELAGAKLLDATRLAREAGSARATNMVIIGAASHLLPVKPETLRGFIARTFARKGEKVVEANLQAFEAGRGAVQWQES